MMNPFLKAAILTVAVLVIGIQLGIWIESIRIEEVREALTEADLLFNDARLLALYYENIPKDKAFCESAFRANLEYNDKIYKQGLEIERYEQVGKLSSALFLERKRYALLQFQFWMNSMRLKKLCNFDYHILLHLWKYEVKDYDLDVKQKLQSNVILELKEKCGAKLMLSPIPVDLNLTSIDTIVRNYNITKMPAMVIDDNITLEGLHSLAEIEEYVKC